MPDEPPCRVCGFSRDAHVTQYRSSPMASPAARGHRMIEDKTYQVTLTIHLSTSVWFAPVERDRPVTKSDAIDNAIGRLPDDVFDGFGGEFEVALPIDGEAVDEDDLP